MKKEMWCATFVEEVEGEIRSFGNVGGFVYDSAESAWDACVKDFNEVRNTYPNAKSRSNCNCNYISLWDDDEKIRFKWEIQRMKNREETQKEDCMKDGNSKCAVKHYMVAYCWQYFQNSRIDGIYGIFTDLGEARKCLSANDERALSASGNTSCRLYEIPFGSEGKYLEMMAEHDNDGCREIYGYAPIRDCDPIPSELAWIRD